MATALVTGITGYVGSTLAPGLRADGFAVRGLTRDGSRVRVPVDELVEGDVGRGPALARALDGVDVAYYLIHSMEAGDGAFPERERRAAERFAAAVAAAGVRRVVYLGGPVPLGARPSEHLASRLAVERLLLDAAPIALALRASIVIGARSRSFRFLVRLVERMPVLALPAWRRYATHPVDGRDVTAALVRAARAPKALRGSWDLAGPDRLTYAELIAGIADAMLVRRPRVGLDLTLTPLAAPIAAKVAGEAVELIRPLMESLSEDLLPRADRDGLGRLGVRAHRFEAAVEHALREWERSEPLRAR